MEIVGIATKFWRYPFKGAQGDKVSHFVVNWKVGIKGDRRDAARRKRRQLTNNKYDLLVCATEPRMAVEVPRYTAAGDLDPQYMQEFAERFEGQFERFEHAPDDGHLGDTEGPQISAYNESTVELFADFMFGRYGIRFDPTTLRMNCAIKGWAPFAELDLTHIFPGIRPAMLGKIEGTVDDMCERCPAPGADIGTGEWLIKDFPGKVAEFVREFRPFYESPHRQKQSVLGFYFKLLEGQEGVINEGDQLVILPSPKK